MGWGPLQRKQQQQAIGKEWLENPINETSTTTTGILKLEIQRGYWTTGSWRIRIFTYFSNWLDTKCLLKNTYDRKSIKSKKALAETNSKFEFADNCVYILYVIQCLQSKTLGTSSHSVQNYAKYLIFWCSWMCMSTGLKTLISYTGWNLEFDYDSKRTTKHHQNVLHGKKCDFVTQIILHVYRLVWIWNPELTYKARD